MAAAAWCNVEAGEQNTVFPARSTGFDASDNDSGTANEAKASDAQNVQAKPGVPPQQWWQLPFDCNFCGLAIKSVAEFDQHIHKQEREQQRQQQERRIWCREYGQSFPSIADRDRHLRTSPCHFCCRYCENLVTFSNDDSLRSHYNTFHHEIYCELCDLHFANTIQCDGHSLAGHCSCVVCHMLFPQPDLCDNRCRTCHVKTGETESRTSPRHFCCRYCVDLFEFNNADSLRSHYVDRHPKMYCSLCDLHFANTIQYHGHFEAGHGSCAVCRKLFSAFDLCDKRCRTCRVKTRGTGLHFFCRYCENLAGFNNADSLRDHYTVCHQQTHCGICDLYFANLGQLLDHFIAGHRFCAGCDKLFSEPDLCDARCRTCHAKNRGTEPPTRVCSEKGLPDHYARLGISRYSTQEQVVRTAKEMRVKMHPDQRKRGLNGLRLSGQEMRMIDEEAAAVGMAADILSDPDLRLKYDRKMFR